MFSYPKTGHECHHKYLICATVTYKIAQNVIEKENQKHKQNYDKNMMHPIKSGWCIKFLSREQPLKANIRFRIIGKTLCIMLRGTHTNGLPVFRIAPVTVGGKVRVVNQNLLLTFGGSMEGDLGMRKIDKMLMNLRITSQQFLMMEDQRLKLCQEILSLLMKGCNPCAAHIKQKSNQIMGLKSCVDG